MKGQKHDHIKKTLAYILSKLGKVIGAQKTRYKKGALDNSETFLIPAGGDGEQSYLSKDLKLKLKKQEWFNGYVGPHGEGLLFELLNNDFNGELIVLTPSMNGASLERELIKHGWASVVVFACAKQIPPINPSSDFHGIGKSYVERLIES